MRLDPKESSVVLRDLIPGAQYRCVENSTRVLCLLVSID